jgi:hypothetical protein
LFAAVTASRSEHWSPPAGVMQCAGSTVASSVNVVASNVVALAGPASAATNAPVINVSVNPCLRM